MLLAAIIVLLAALYLHRVGARPFALPHPKQLRRLPDSPFPFWRVIADNRASFV
jgi:hypothetical protein